MHYKKMKYKIQSESITTSSRFVGWRGPDCSQDIDECKVSNKSCSNERMVCENSDGSFICKCGQSVAERQCDPDINECFQTWRCKNGGTCENTVGSYKCRCPPTFGGPTCDNKLVGCQLENNTCTNGGTCAAVNQTFQCVCVKNFGGINCEERLTAAVRPKHLLFDKANILLLFKNFLTFAKVLGQMLLISSGWMKRLEYCLVSFLYLFFVRLSIFCAAFIVKWCRFNSVKFCETHRLKKDHHQ